MEVIHITVDQKARGGGSEEKGGGGEGRGREGGEGERGKRQGRRGRAREGGRKGVEREKERERMLVASFLVPEEASLAVDLTSCFFLFLSLT